MTRLRCLLSSLLVAASLSTACFASTPTAPAKPVAAETSIRIDRAQVRAKLAERRAVMIERFLAYREARVYPWNRGVLTTRHIWFDDLGNLCAAATLISYDWGRASTIKVGEADRGLQLAKVKTGEVADWIATSGLTHHEIVAIQAPAIGVEDPMIRDAEIERLYALYTDVERQLRTLGDESLDLATDALVKRPDLARRLLAGKLPGAGKFTVEQVDVRQPSPMPVPAPAA